MAEKLSFDSGWTLFLDRDGVLNRKLEGDYVKKVDEFRWLAGAERAVANLNTLFGRTIILTNQAGIGKGLMSGEDLNAVHAHLLQTLAAKDGKLDGIYHCPHRPDAGCSCRKPATGLALQAQQDFPDIDFSRSVMVGDSLSDLRMGRALGMFTVLIGPPTNEAEGLWDAHFPSIRDMASWWVEGKAPQPVFSAEFWNERYLLEDFPWDLGHATAPMLHIMKTLTDKHQKILLAGGGTGHEAWHLHEQGFSNVYLLDWSPEVVNRFCAQHPAFPNNHVLCMDFFQIDGTFDVALEQTFYCALPPELRDSYVQKMHSILNPGGILTGVMFEFPLVEQGPPWGGSREEYRQRFSPFFEIEMMESCTVSEPSRAGREVLVRMRKK